MRHECRASLGLPARECQAAPSLQSRLRPMDRVGPKGEAGSLAQRRGGAERNRKRMCSGQVEGSVGAHGGWGDAVLAATGTKRLEPGGCSLRGCDFFTGTCQSILRSRTERERYPAMVWGRQVLLSLSARAAGPVPRKLGMIGFLRQASTKNRRGVKKVTASPSWSSPRPCAAARESSVPVSAEGCTPCNPLPPSPAISRVRDESEEAAPRAPGSENRDSPVAATENRTAPESPTGEDHFPSRDFLRHPASSRERGEESAGSASPAGPPGEWIPLPPAGVDPVAWAQEDEKLTAES